MGIEERILDYQLTHEVFDNAGFSGAEGIAKRAVTQGFSSLSPKQKLKLEPYLSITCSGVTDPGGHHNECLIELKGEELLNAYDRYDGIESLVCESCDCEKATYAHEWDKISQE